MLTDMKCLFCAVAILLPHALLACDTAVCRVDPDTLSLPRAITFDGTRKSFGPGHPVDGILKLEGAQFGERFAGHSIAPAGLHDQITGTPFAPLTLMAGAQGQNLSVVGFMGVSVLNGYGPAGYPNREAQGEGAIAWLFDEDQYALTIHIRGGESGAAQVSFLRRDGALLARIDVAPVGEDAVGFLRRGGIDDIAGVVITNTDPQGIAIDTIRFGKPLDLS